MDETELRAAIERDLDEMMMGAENYFGAVNPKRAGHIRCALDRIMVHIPSREESANLVAEMIAQRKHPGERVVLAIAAGAVRRGRHLSAKEQLENLSAAMMDQDPPHPYPQAR